MPCLESVLVGVEKMVEKVVLVVVCGCCGYCAGVLGLAVASRDGPSPRLRLSSAVILSLRKLPLQSCLTNFSPRYRPVVTVCPPSPVSADPPPPWDVCLQ